MTSGTTIQRPDLALVAVEYMDDQQFYVGQLVAPVLRVAAQAADYPLFTKEYWQELPNVDRSPRGTYNRGDWEGATDTYSCRERGWEEPVDDVEAKLYARFFDAEKASARRATGILMRNHEYRVLTPIQGLSANSVSNEWDDADNATPLGDVNTGKNAILDLTGVEPDTLLIAYTTFQDLGVCDEVIERIKYTHPEVVKGQLTAALLAGYFGVERLLVSRAAYNSAKEGQDATMTKMWDEEYAALLCTESAQSLEKPQYMRTFLWTEDSPTILVVESYYEDQIRGDVIRVRHQTDEEVINSEAVYLMDNIAS